MGNYFSKNLKYIREKRNLSQNKLADMIGVNQTTIARWEDDNRTPNLDNAIDVSKILDIPLPDLIGRNLSIEANNNDTKKIATSNGVQIYIDKIEPLTAQDVLEVNKVLMEKLDEIQRDDKKEK